MGFTKTADTITITAKLTEKGREKMLKMNNSVFSHFMLGDSDANYYTSVPLSTGLIPTASGELSLFGVEHHDNVETPVITSRIKISNQNIFKKPVKQSSTYVSNEVANLGTVTVSGSNLTYAMLSKSATTVDFTNLFHSLSLPLTTDEINVFISATTYGTVGPPPLPAGGWLDTAYSGLGAENILIAVIDNDVYGELIDGKNIKCSLPIATGYTPSGIVDGITTYDIYSTFPQTTSFTPDQLDNQYKDNSPIPKSLFPNNSNKNINVSYLVSDNIKRPNSDPLLNWSTGFQMYKPFEINNKQLIHQGPSVPSAGFFADRVVGVAYLDKGILAFTDQEIVNNIVTNFTGDTETGTITNLLGLYFYSGGTYNTIINSIDNNIIQNILCEASAGEFYESENKTRVASDNVRISEVAICDAAGNILAIGKSDRQIVKLKQELRVFNIQIVV